jgi:hypothetical protein
MPRRRGVGRPPVARRMARTRRRRRRRRVMLVGGLVAYGAHKMSTKDADRIKEHTGVDPEELEDAELEQAMTELNIEKQAVTAADQEVGGGESGEANSEPVAHPQAASAPSAGYIEELQQLAALRDQGILTDDEFNKKKAQILGLG